MTSAHVDWLTGTTELDVGDVLELVHDVTDGADFEVKPGRWMYKSRFVTVEGIEVLADPHDAVAMPAVCVNVPGAGCVYLGAERLQRIASILKPTRLDFAWDGVPFTVADVAAWVRGGDMRTRLRSATLHESVMGADGNGVTLGTRNGTAQVVAYDRRGPVRLEFRLRGERAAAAYDLLMASPETWSAAFAELLRGVVDFVDRSHGTRPDRAPLLASWETFVGHARRVVVALAGGVAPSFERARAWVRHQVARTLAMLEDAGEDVAALTAYGRSRLRTQHRVRAHGWLHGPPAQTSTA